MKTGQSKRLIHVFVAGAVASAMCGVANAQSTSAGGTKDASSSMVLAPVTITGTIIQGIAPVGTHVTTITTRDIIENGAATTQDLLSKSPLLTSNFNAIRAVRQGGTTSTYVNIHNLPGDGADPTLQLLNGMDFVGAGVLFASPDIGVIPPGVLKNIQIVANGGNAIYGADAVGGIVNLITRKGMKGVKVSANYGWATGYSSYSASLSFGNRWRTGSYIFSYDHESRQPLFGASRGYYRSYLPSHPTAGNQLSQQCSLANVYANGQSYGMPSLIPGTQNLCDDAPLSSIIQPQRQNTLYFGMRQLLSSSIRFSLTAYWSDRSDYVIGAQPGAVGTITNANPFFIPLGGATSELVRYSFAPVAGPTHDQTGLALHEFGMTPKFSFKLPHGWSLDWTTYLGRSITTLVQNGVNSAANAAALKATTVSTALDPYNITSTNPSVIANILDQQNYFSAAQSMLETKLIAQGGIVRLPAGEAHLAIGAQWQYQSYHDVDGNYPVGQHPTSYPANTFISQGDAAAFGELMAPIIGSQNRIPGVRSLTFDAQGRIDHYTSWGSTINPKVGLDWTPMHGLLVYGTYGTSFVAPGLSAISTVGNEAQVFPTSTFGPGPFNTRPTILMAGTIPGLGPESGATYTAGFSARPVWLPGGSLRVTYWHTTINNIQTAYPYNQQSYFFDNYPSAYIAQPTVAQLDAFIHQYAPTDHVVGLVTSLADLNALYDNPATTPWVVINAQGTNLGSTFLDGIDFNAQYVHRMRYGELIATAEGTYTLQDQITQGPATRSMLYLSGSRLLARATLGDHYRHWFLRFAVDYASGYPVLGITDQSNVGAFHPVDALLTYHIKRRFDFKDMLLTFKIDNIANEAPSYLNRPPFVGNGNVRGRYFEFGLTAHF